MSLPAILEQSPGQDEARTLRRKRLRLTVPATLPTSAKAVIVHDISVAGLLLETDSAIATGESIVVELPDRRQVEARVVWSSGHFFGCEFFETIAPALVSASLLKSEPRPLGDDQPVALERFADEQELEDEDRIERGSLSIASRIQIVLAISLGLWALIATIVALLI